MPSPRWTYSETNALRWRPTFDALIIGQQGAVVEIPLAGNARSLHSLHVRIGDAVKWLADQYKRTGNGELKPYAEMKPRLRFGIGAHGLLIQLRQPAVIDATTNQHKSLNLDVETIKRLSEMSNNPKYSEAERQTFTQTLKLELGLQDDCVSY